MCNKEESIKFCSCGKKVKRNTFFNRIFRASKSKSLQTYIDKEAKDVWYLFSRENQQWLDGELIINEHLETCKQTQKATFQYIKDALNTRKDCFDFAYIPQENDLLVVKFQQKLVEFVFDEGEWYLNIHEQMEMWDHWLLNKGIVKKG